jgi:hypothetical protein
MSRKYKPGSYNSLLERPKETPALRRVRRHRVMTLLAGLAIAIVVAVLAFSLMRSGLIATVDPPAEPSSTTTAAVSAAVATPSAEASASLESAADPAPTVIEIGWVGDLTPGSKYGNPPDEGKALFENTREYLSEPDVMIANLEGTFGDGGASKCDDTTSTACYAFQAPPENAAALAWAGIDVVNLANNHSMDYFAAGLTSTKDALADNGVDYTGLDDSMAIREIDGVRVAVLGFSPYPWSPDIGDLDAAAALVREADEQADIVVVTMHAGAEGADKTHTPNEAEYAYGEFRGNSRAFAHAVIDAGADLVVGSGPHVVRGMERYGDGLIAYSLGNFAGWKNFNRSGDLALSGLLTVRVDEEGDVVGGRWLSLRIADPGVPRVDWDREAVALVNELSAEDFESPVTMAKDGLFEFEEQ